jgi:hypothetical protein
MNNRDYKPPFRFPPFTYFLAAACCLAGSGFGCQFLSRDLPGDNLHASSIGVSLGFILLAGYLSVKGICHWDD